MSQQLPRRIDAFFYGLFMDEAVLRQSGVTPVDARRAMSPTSRFASDNALPSSLQREPKHLGCSWL